MSKRDQYPAGVPRWVETLQPQPEAAVEFDGPLFGWEFSGPEPMPGGIDRAPHSPSANPSPAPAHDYANAPAATDAIIREYRPQDEERVVELSREAWASVFVRGQRW